MITALFVFKDKTELIVNLERHVAEIWFNDKKVKRDINKFGTVFIKE